MNSHAKLAVVAVAALVAVGSVVLRPSQAPSVAGGISPSPSRSPSPAPIVLRAENFRHPFTYDHPLGRQWSLLRNTSTTYEFIIPDSEAQGYSAVGVIVQATGGGRADPCAPSSDSLRLTDGRGAAIEYLKTIPTLEVAAESSTTFGGMPARQVDIKPGQRTSDCPDVWLWATDTEAFSSGYPRGMTLRTVLFEIRGDPVIVGTWVFAYSKASWQAVADQLIATIDFESSNESPSASRSSG